MLNANLLLLGLAAGCLGAQDPPPFQIAVHVDLVVLPVTVRDQAGRLVDDLREQDFAVFENGANQALRLFRHEDAPVTVGLVVDHSGSMRRKIIDVLGAARAFARTSHPQDEMFVVNFNEAVAYGPFTKRPEELEAMILRSPVDGQTALYDAMAAAFEQLQRGSYGKKALVVISDGADNASKQTLAQVLDLARRRDVLIYTVGIFAEDDPDGNPNVLRKLARAAGGEAYFPKQPDELAAVCSRIAQELRHQYTLGYLSTFAGPPGAYRGIRVTARRDHAGKKLTVRTRAGFIAGASAP